jgi:hypothetical protein
MDQLLPETRSITYTLSAIHRDKFNPLPSIVHPKDFKDFYKVMAEHTSSSPSGRHQGHYKAALSSPDLVELYSTIIGIPLLRGVLSNCGHQVVDVMLNKKEGDHCIHHLRIIALQKSYFNKVNCIAIGCPLMHALEDSKFITDVQHGSRPSKLCHSTMLNKQLTYEIHL